MSIQMNREHVKEVFRIYTDHYDSTDEKVRLKIDHTYRVAVRGLPCLQGFVRRLILPG